MCEFFCFKQKTAYEMRISDWSSDVCSSDLGVDAEVAHAFGIRRDGNEVLRHRGRINAEPVQAPCARRVCVGQGFQRGEGLGADDEQRLRRVQPAHALAEVGAVDVGHEAELHVATRAEEHTSELKSLKRN